MADKRDKSITTAHLAPANKTVRIGIEDIYRYYIEMALDIFLKKPSCEQ
jgi:hypothetical protein